ncbi:MAG: hypothetical protein WCA07_06850 [Gloeobacterales cyanobacterium]
MKQKIILFTSTTLAAFVLVVIGGISSSLIQSKQTIIAEQPNSPLVSMVQAQKPVPTLSNRASEIAELSPVQDPNQFFERNQMKGNIYGSHVKKTARIEQENEGEYIAFDEHHAEHEYD